MSKAATMALVLCVGLVGCAPRGQEEPRPAGAVAVGEVPPLSLQQARAYPETVTGRFVPLCDFEDVPDGPPGHEQVGHFSIQPLGERYRKFVVNITRTGTGAMEVALMPRNRLVFSLPEVHDFTGYRLLSMALYSEALRDDLCVTLRTDSTLWRSPRTLVRPGWNNVLIDIQRLQRLRRFDCRNVRTLELEFADAVGQVTFNVDDIMLIDNRRAIGPVPRGFHLEKSGLDYALRVPGRLEPLKIAQCPDGLWRLGDDQAVVCLARPGRPCSTEGEDLELMGPRTVGRLEVQEHNDLRIRLQNVWYFPTRAGEWASLAVRQIRWDYTFYRDGRWVTHLELNNAGGDPLGAVRVRLPRPATWTDGRTTRELHANPFTGPVGRWGFLQAPEGLEWEPTRREYGVPARIRPSMAAATHAPGDAARDGFDESQGCYFLQATPTGHCRFTILPPTGGLASPVFRVAGPWKRLPRVSAAGLALPNVARADEHSILFLLPGRILHPLAVEVTGGALPEAP